MLVNSVSEINIFRHIQQLFFIANLKIKSVGRIDYSQTPGIIFGEIQKDLPDKRPDSLKHWSKELYIELLSFFAARAECRLARVWNFVPNIVGLPGTVEREKTNYEFFNAGRFDAFQACFGQDVSCWNVPAASATGTKTGKLEIQFLGIQGNPLFIQNSQQVPSVRYSKKFGPKPPLFTRGVIFESQGNHYLYTAGTASVTGEDSCHENDLSRQLELSFANVMFLSSLEHLSNYGLRLGFTLRDSIYWRAYLKSSYLAEEAEQWRKRIGIHHKFDFYESTVCREELLIELEAFFVR